MPDDPDDEGVLAPTDLDIDDHDRVRPLDGDRYVVEANGPDDAPAVGADEAPTLPDGAYALAARARAGPATDSLRVDSDDVAASFEALVRWYVGLVAPDESPEAAVATLLRHASLDIEVEIEAGNGDDR
jgi:hypothetical protein